MEGYDVSDISDEAWLDRFCHLKFSPDLEESTGYYAANEMLEWSRFISAYPNFLHANKSVFEIDAYCKPSNRSNENAARLAKLNAPTELLSGCIGVAATIAYTKWKDDEASKAVSADDVMNEYKKVQKRVIKLAKEGKIAELGTTLNEIEAKATEEDKKDDFEYDYKTVGSNVAAFLSDLAEFGALDLAYKGALQLSLINSINMAISGEEGDTDKVMKDRKQQLRLENLMIEAKASGKVKSAVKKEEA